MKVKDKKFDCVEMKRLAQKKILKEIEDLSHEEQIKHTNETIESDPVFGPLWRRLMEKCKQRAG